MNYCFKPIFLLCSITWDVSNYLNYHIIVNRLWSSVCGLTGADVHDVVEGVAALHDVHHQPGEAHVVLGQNGVHADGLHHVVHQEEALRVLQRALRQVLLTRLALLQRPALEQRVRVRNVIFTVTLCQSQLGLHD